MCVLDNNNGRNDTPQLSQSTKYDKLILTSDLRTPEQLVQECHAGALLPPHTTERS